MYHYCYCVTFILYTLKINSVLLDVQIRFYFMSDLEVFDVLIASKSTDQAQLFCTLFAPVVFVARVTQQKVKDRRSVTTSLVRTALSRNLCFLSPAVAALSHVVTSLLKVHRIATTLRRRSKYCTVLQRCVRILKSTVMTLFTSRVCVRSFYRGSL